LRPNGHAIREDGAFNNVYHLMFHSRSYGQADAGETNSSITRNLVEGKYGLAVDFPSSLSFSTIVKQFKACYLLRRIK